MYRCTNRKSPMEATAISRSTSWTSQSSLSTACPRLLHLRKKSSRPKTSSHRRHSVAGNVCSTSPRANVLIPGCCGSAHISISGSRSAHHDVPNQQPPFPPANSPACPSRPTPPPKAASPASPTIVSPTKPSPTSSLPPPPSLCAEPDVLGRTSTPAWTRVLLRGTS